MISVAFVDASPVALFISQSFNVKVFDIVFNKVRHIEESRLETLLWKSWKLLCDVPVCLFTTLFLLEVHS